MKVTFLSYDIIFILRGSMCNAFLFHRRGNMKVDFSWVLRTTTNHEVDV